MIGYYAHHHGHGHLQRALCVARHTCHPLTILTSLPQPPELPAGVNDWVTLDRDDQPMPTGDPSANGVWHWAPPHHPGLRRRMATISAWLDRTQPGLIVVDVSVEIAALSRLHGVPVVVVAMPGDRSDRAHRLGYDLAEALLACWPLTTADPDWPTSWTDKTWFVGAFSRYDCRIRETDPATVKLPVPQRRMVTVLLGGGGTDLPDGYLDAAIRATPGWKWDIIGGPGSPWRPDPWPSLRAADVIVSHAGQNAVAEVAAARTPAIIIAQSRPHAEQHATAAALHRGGLATVLHHWPHPPHWVGLLETAAQRDGRRWARWCPGDGAARAAHLLDLIATSTNLTAFDRPQPRSAGSAIAHQRRQ